MREQIPEIVEQLQAHLNSAELIDLGLGHQYRKPVASIRCLDGTEFSIQAGEMAYSTPRSNTGPWMAVEVMTLSSGVTPSWDTDDCEIGAYVPIEQVAQEIISRGFLPLTAD